MSYSFCEFAPELVLSEERVCVRNSTACWIVVTNRIYCRYIYYQAIGIDACFRFKRRQVSSYERDPELGPGYAYLVVWDAYNEYLSRFSDQKEVCCVRLSEVLPSLTYVVYR